MSSSGDRDELLGLFGATLAWAALLTIVGATLFPYEFHLTVAGWKLSDFELLRETPWQEAARDAFANVLLFVPLGFAMACWRDPRPGHLGVGLGLAAAVGIGVSLAVECLQLLIPARVPSALDFAANVTGSLLGFLAFPFWGPEPVHQLIARLVRLRRRIGSILTPGVALTGYAVYATVALFVSMELQRGSALSNWDDDFPLLIGNEATGDRPWRGRVERLQVMARALSAAEIERAFAKDGVGATLPGPLVADYDLQEGGISDDRSGNLPPLVPRNDGPTAEDAWLGTETPAVRLALALRSTSQFTLAAVVRTADTDQDGPARVISLSAGTDQRDFTLGQMGSSLAFRLRTPITGRNGNQPQMMAWGVFATTAVRHLVITYDGSTVRLHVDGVQHPRRLPLGPGPALAKWLRVPSSFALPGYQVVYGALIFVPLMALLFAFARSGVRSPWVRGFLLAIGLLAAPLGLEAALVAVSGKWWSFGQVGAGFAVGLAALVLLRLGAPATPDDAG